MAFSTIEIKKELRPCLCNFKKALFHGWFETGKPIAKINAMLTDKAIERLTRKIEIGQIPPPSHLDIILQNVVVGIVEFEDGTIAEVEPKTIIFIDTAEFMNEYDFGERKE